MHILAASIMLLLSIAMHGAQQDASPTDQTPAHAQDAEGNGNEDGDDAGTLADAPTTAEELLGLLEADAGSLDDFTGRIRVTKIDPILGDEEWNVGRVFFDFDHEHDRKRFAIQFTRKGMNNRARDTRRQYIFDGMWLVEKDPEQKQFIKRQIVRPGETFDPLKLGEGPIPLPIAQDKDEVLKRFEVALIPSPTEGFLSKALAQVEVHGLSLTPKPGFSVAEEFNNVKIWFDRANLLPVGVDADGRKGRTIVWLWDLQRNAGIDASVLDTSVPKDVDGWRVDIRAWRESEREGDGG